ncbi:class A beta-lactamase-related serine hydrolase [Aliishimia ponticola]|uniref:Class A beta-lactamase-related serine hydrolase n=1 Tax=Aliishimia ponticola TaxID=2499833 RepID=A0A4S4NM76_9RHOB|nr:serine hydrolase domain-containing protein [Aliishimia ponticola]THH37330.1 class A beta-lactamase-related serine hydrolase [Aliishimia ponticola]
MLRAALICLALASPVAAQDGPARMQAAFSGWLKTHDTTGALGVGLRGPGGWTFEGAADRPGELASLSKAITAICALKLVEEGALDWSDTVAQHLGRGPEATVAQLVTHTSGLEQDSTQGDMPAWLAAQSSSHRGASVLDRIVARGGPAGTAGRFHYNNENYALLGLVIETASGQGFAEACDARLGLSPGIRVSAQTAAFAPWGGMYGAAPGFLAFVQTHFGLGSRVASDPFALPHADMGGGVYYGLGMVFRRFNDSFNFWHFGALCFPGALDAGSFVVMFEGKVSALALYDACVSWDDMFALDAALAGAVYRR